MAVDRGPAAGVAVSLAEATDEARFGGKAANLAVATAHGLPVPPAVVLSWTLVEAVADGEEDASDLVIGGCRDLGSPLAVRSSAVGEDSARASFAGQHRSVLNVGTPEDVVDAVRSVWESAHETAAVAYRRRLGLPATPRVGVIVQRLLDADIAGVLFDGNPLTGAHEIVIESAWGLGEAVVAGSVTPDLFRLGPEGELSEQKLGTKDVELRPSPDGGTTAHPVAPDRAEARTLSDEQLRELFAMARRCREVFGGTQDLEWAYAGGKLWLLQRRPVTA